MAPWVAKFHPSVSAALWLHLLPSLPRWTFWALPDEKPCSCRLNPVSLEIKTNKTKTSSCQVSPLHVQVTCHLPSPFNIFPRFPSGPSLGSYAIRPFEKWPPPPLVSSPAHSHTTQASSPPLKFRMILITLSEHQRLLFAVKQFRSEFVTGKTGNDNLMFLSVVSGLMFKSKLARSHSLWHTHTHRLVHVDLNICPCSPPFKTCHLSLHIVFKDKFHSACRYQESTAVQ